MGCDGNRRGGESEQRNVSRTEHAGGVKSWQGGRRHNKQRAESARQWFKPGVQKGVGVIHRSGGVAWGPPVIFLGKPGVRLSSIVHIGGDAV